MKYEENNYIYISGIVGTEPELSHEAYGEKFYEFELDSRRDSGCIDTLNISVSDRLVDIKNITVGCKITVSGQIRSRNEKSGNRPKLVLRVFATEILMDQPDLDEVNNVELIGFVCKEPTYRKTPLGREITDLFLAVNRSCGRSDYIPCICWGRNARYASDFAVGDHLQIKGRFQNREYQKKICEGQFETRTAYEVSASLVTVIENKGD